MHTQQVFSRIVFAICFLGLASFAVADEPKVAKQPQDGSLFNGKNLEGWKIITKYDFEKHGKVTVNKGEIILEKGRPATGISYQKKMPRINYEVSLDAKRIEGEDFFCGLTFPVGKSYCSLIIGGWGGGVTGLSNIDNMSAVENETTGYVEFKKNQWYHIRLRVTDKNITAWVDKEEILGVDTKDRKLSIWWEQEPVRPFGIATWHTKAALRNLKLTPILAPK